jgi:hypothetical protein
LFYPLRDHIRYHAFVDMSHGSQDHAGKTQTVLRLGVKKRSAPW